MKGEPGPPGRTGQPGKTVCTHTHLYTQFSFILFYDFVSVISHHMQGPQGEKGMKGDTGMKGVEGPKVSELPVSQCSTSS